MTHPIDGAILRQVMRRVASPVTVVTARGEDEVRGITIGSFTSVSLDPPLVSFNVQHVAQMHEVITRTDRFNVHLLRDDQAHLSEHFALPDLSGTDQFADVPHTFDEAGVPVLDDVLAVLTCTRYATYPAGDHVLLLGEVIGIEGDASGEAQPLLYFDRGYRSVGDERPALSFDAVKRGSSSTS